MTDEEVRKVMEDANAAMNAAEKLVQEHFMPRLHAAIAAGEQQAALGIVAAIPSDCVTKVFALDAIRQAGWSMRDRKRGA